MTGVKRLKSAALFLNLSWSSILAIRNELLNRQVHTAALFRGILNKAGT